MGPFIPFSAVAKGPLFHHLDEMSTRPNARDLLTTLEQALSNTASSDFPNLEMTLAHHLFLPLGVAAPQIRSISDYFISHWLDVGSPDVYFPEKQPIAPIIGTGLLKTLQLSLSGAPQPKPVDLWWVLDYPDVEIINLVSARQVTLLLATPRPAGRPPAGIWRTTAEAYTTGLLGLVTRKYV